LDQVAPPIETNGVAIGSGEVLASCGQTQDQAKLNNIRPLVGLNAVYTCPAELRMPERVMLYSLIFALQPQNCLEIGTFRGGSTAIICGAMDDTGFGQLACVDPMPQVAPELWSQIEHRCRMFQGPSPDILPEVARQTDVEFDFAFIDANHTYDFVRRDIEGVLPLLTSEAYLLFHDGNYPDVRRAVDAAVTETKELSDCGLVSVEPTVLHENGQSVRWAGLRLVRYRRSLAA
jgi:predicted O-methyltransferase YrrM